MVQLSIAVSTIDNTRYIPKSLAENGSIKLSRHKIAKIRGQLFLTKSDIILNYDLLDTPEFFTIHELFEMLADEQKYQHSSILEWIIIGLISFEIGMTIIDKLF